MTGKENEFDYLIWIAQAETMGISGDIADQMFKDLREGRLDPSELEVDFEEDYDIEDTDYE